MNARTPEPGADLGPLLSPEHRSPDPNAAAFSIVVPTVGCPSLADLLGDLLDDDESDRADGKRRTSPTEILVVDDRPNRDEPLRTGSRVPPGLRIIEGRARGPAAARNDGWRAASTPWIVFLDDDVRLGPDWSTHLGTDLTAADHETGSVHAKVRVPAPDDRAPTDAERAILRLADAGWITADAAIRRPVLETIGGFDERFPRAYREDTDLVLRMLDAGHRPVRGEREIIHPLRDDGPWSSLRRQAGNIDDALLDRIHGPAWRDRLGIARGTRRRHVATTLAAGAALVALLRRRTALAAVTAAAAAASLVTFHRQRRSDTSNRPEDRIRLAATSIAIPPLATTAWIRGVIRARRLVPVPRSRTVRAALFDRDGTLVDDVPYNGDPALVSPVPGARDELDRLRRAGIDIAIVSNQRGIALGRLDLDDLGAVNERLRQLLGPVPVIACCPHDDTDGCGCRKPRPGLIHAAAQHLGVRTRECIVVGDIGSDVMAAAAAGTDGILVPTAATLPDEITDAPIVETDLRSAVDRILETSR